ncbi:MAG: C69 family dipeptidase [Clostridia bacterium]|nr:C69 family dipeptidase [Clostridia bacterium]
MKKVLCIAVCFMICLLSVAASACTGVYVGKEASTDGTIIIARSNDSQGNYPTRVMVSPRVEQDPNRKMPVDSENSQFFDLPVTTYKYIGTPMMDSAILETGSGMDDAVCVNEYGVAMTMSVTAFICLTDYMTYGIPVRKYWHTAEKHMIDAMASELESVNELLKSDPAKAQRQMTVFCSDLQEKAFEDGKALLNEVRWAMSANSNTMKMGMNPETDEMYSTERVLEPIKVELDVAPYKGETD